MLKVTQKPASNKNKMRRDSLNKTGRGRNHQSVSGHFFLFYEMTLLVILDITVKKGVYRERGGRGKLQIDFHQNPDFFF